MLATCSLLLYCAGTEYASRLTDIVVLDYGLGISPFLEHTVYIGGNGGYCVYCTVCSAQSVMFIEDIFITR